MSENQGDLFDQPEPPPIDPGVKAVLSGEQKARARDLERRRKRLGPPIGDGETMKQEFERFHAENPHVYEALVDLCLEARRRGFECWSIAGAYEVARWECRFSTTDKNFKLRNNFKAYYARLIMESVPELEGFFRIAELRA